MPAPNARPRIINSDGTTNIRRIGMRRAPLNDIYHFLLRAKWRTLLAILLAIYMSTNAVFACLFLIQEGSIEGAEAGSFTDAFFFSVQSLSTIGYGGMSPATFYAHVLVTIEALFGLLLTATSTGMVFAKFAIPTARISFSNNVLLTTHDGKRVLTFRIANQRTNQIMEAQLTVTFSRDETTKEGHHVRRFYDLALTRGRSAIFGLGWSVYHIIDEDSPLFELSPDELEEQNMVLIAAMSGMDDTMSAAVHARHAYDFQDLIYDHRFVDTFLLCDDGTRCIDYRRFHLTEPQNPS